MFCEVNLLGRISKEPELIEAIKTAKAVKFSVAYNSAQKKADNSGYESCFVNCVAFGFNADKALEKLKKGSMVSIRGNLQINSKQDKSGGWVYYTNIAVERMVCFGDKNAQNTTTNAPKSKAVNTSRDFSDKYDLDDDGVMPF